MFNNSGGLSGRGQSTPQPFTHFAGSLHAAPSKTLGGGTEAKARAAAIRARVQVINSRKQALPAARAGMPAKPTGHGAFGQAPKTRHDSNPTHGGPVRRPDRGRPSPEDDQGAEDIWGPPSGDAITIGPDNAGDPGIWDLLGGIGVGQAPEYGDPMDDPYSSPYMSQALGMGLLTGMANGHPASAHEALASHLINTMIRPRPVGSGSAIHGPVHTMPHSASLGLLG